MNEISETREETKSLAPENSPTNSSPPVWVVVLLMFLLPAAWKFIAFQMQEQERERARRREIDQHFQQALETGKMGEATRRLMGLPPEEPKQP